MRQIFLDTETTGLSPESGDRIIEIGCVEMLNRRLSGRNLHFYVNPQRRSHEDAVKIHGRDTAVRRFLVIPIRPHSTRAARLPASGPR